MEASHDSDLDDTPEGKAKSPLNAVRTGLTGRTVLLPGDDADAYNRHTERCLAAYEPGDHNEEELIQSIANTEWRLLRIPSLEMSIYAVGRLELASAARLRKPSRLPSARSCV